MTARRDHHEIHTVFSPLSRYRIRPRGRENISDF